MKRKSLIHQLVAGYTLLVFVVMQPAASLAQIPTLSAPVPSVTNPPTPAGPDGKPLFDPSVMNATAVPVIANVSGVSAPVSPAFSAALAAGAACDKGGVLNKAMDLTQSTIQAQLIDRLTKHKTPGADETAKGAGTSAGSFTAEDCKNTGLVDAYKAKNYHGEYSCTSFIQSADNIAKTMVFDNEARDDAEKEKTAFQKWLDAYKAACTGTKAQAELDNKKAVLNCQLQALQNAMSIAQQMVEASATNNQKSFDNISKTGDALQDQYAKVMEVLGPDPDPALANSKSPQTQGLLGLQTFLKARKTQWVDDASKLGDEVTKATNSQKAYNDWPKKDLLKNFSQCIQAPSTAAAGGSPLYCMVKDTTAKGCRWVKQEVGPLAYITCKANELALGNQGCDGVRQQDGLNNASAVKSAAASLLTNIMGNNVGASGANSQTGQAGPGDGSVSSMTLPPIALSGNFNEQTLLNPVLNSLQAASLTIHSNDKNAASNYRNDVKSAFESCWNSAVTMQTNDLTNSNEYLGLKQASDKDTKAANNDMQLKLGDVNDAYKAMQAVMNKQHITLNLKQCSSTADLVTQQKCFSDNVTLVNNLSDGNGSNSFQNQQFQSKFPSAPNLFADCSKGLDQCVTNLLSLRDVRLKPAIKAVNGKKADFAKDQATKTNAEYGAYAKMLQQFQGSAIGQSLFALNAMGAKITDPTTVEGSKLVSKCTNDKDPGPCLTVPENGSAGALSALAGGAKGGLYQAPQNPAFESGYASAKEALQKHDADILKSIDDMQAQLNKLNKLSKSSILSKGCDNKNVSDNGDNGSASNFTDDCTNCKSTVSSCETSLGTLSSDEYVKAGGDSKNYSTQRQALFKWISEVEVLVKKVPVDADAAKKKTQVVDPYVSLPCVQLKDACDQCITKKNEDYQKGLIDANGRPVTKGTQ